jgi:hypothetical protein
MDLQRVLPESFTAEVGDREYWVWEIEMSETSTAVKELEKAGLTVPGHLKRVRKVGDNKTQLLVCDAEGKERKDLAAKLKIVDENKLNRMSLATEIPAMRVRK